MDTVPFLDPRPSDARRVAPLEGTTLAWTTFPPCGPSEVLVPPHPVLPSGERGDAQQTVQVSCKNRVSVPG